MTVGEPSSGTHSRRARATFTRRVRGRGRVGTAWWALPAIVLLLAAEGAGAQPTIGTPVTPRVPGRQAPAVRGIAVDARLATDAGVRVGDTLRLSAEAGRAGEPVVVEALVERGADPSEVARSEYRVRLHLDHLQRLIGADDRVDRFAVAAREEAGSAAVDSLLAGINHVAFGFRAHASRDVAVQSSRTFQVVDRFHRAIGGITIVASAVFLLCILLLKVEERRRAVAALRLAGLSRRTVALSVMAEAAVVAVLGSVAGAAIGWVATLLVNAHYQRVFRTPLTFAVLTPQIALFAVTLSLALGVVAGALAAWRLVRTPPLTLLGR
jgi:putative ABC transport system permease protein